MNKIYTILSLGALAGCRSAQPKDSVSNPESNPAPQSIDGVVNETPISEPVNGNETVPVNEVPIPLAPTQTEGITSIELPSNNGVYQCVKEHPYATVGIGVVLALGAAYLASRLINANKITPAYTGKK